MSTGLEAAIALQEDHGTTTAEFQPGLLGGATASFSLGQTAFWVPARVVESAWLGHIPFAFWLTSVLRPRVLVELGTHTGASYCAFCQAIDGLQIDTAAYAVDSWEGDPHAGFYGDNVFAELNQYNERQYGSFSRLLRCSFDDALSYFSDGEIDLLHIDGYHTYEAVSHDFHSWLPKLSQSAVVLLHDINVREKDFGVWRFWQEIAATYPSFAFYHHHGLGVACIGSVRPSKLDRLLALGRDPLETAMARNSFARLGQGIQATWEAAHHAGEAERLHQQAGALSRDRDALAGRLAQSEEQRSGLVTSIERLGAEHATSVSQLELLAAEHAASISQLELLAAEHAAGVRERERLATEHTAEVRERERLAAESSQLRSERDQGRSAGAAIAADRDVARHDLDRYMKGCETLQRELDKHRRRRHKLQRSLLWRATRPLRAVVGTLGRPFKQPKNRRRARAGSLVPELSSALAVEQRGEPGAALLDVPTSGRTYADWVAAYDTLSDTDREEIAAHIARLGRRPLISVVMPVYNTDPTDLRAAIESVRGQLYPNWQLCIADDASTEAEVHEVLADYADDDRIRIIYRDTNGHISAASNDALSLAEGEFIALMDHDDLIPEHALYEVAVAINEQPDVDLIYSDEDQLDRDRRRAAPYFKPDWDPELMLAHNLINHLGVYRRSILADIGGFQAGFEGSQDYDLALRFLLRTSSDRIRHIPTVLYHWRKNQQHASFSSDSLDRCTAAARRAIAEYLAAKATEADVLPLPAVPSWSRIKYRLPQPQPMVTAIIATRDRADLLAKCLDGLRHRTHYERLEIIVVDNDSSEPETLQLLEQAASEAGVRVLRFPGPFNFSAMNNFAADHAAGDILLLLNNDIEVIHPNWLDEMVSYAGRVGIGAVGAKLIYPDRRIQHAGVVLGVGGVAGHFGHFCAHDDPGYSGLLAISRSVSAVTAACLAVKRCVFKEVGGLNDTELKVAFNDVDLCLRIRQAGYRNIYCSFAELYHHESASRGSDQTPDKIQRFSGEVEYMKRAWNTILASDPYYNPNFDLSSENFALGWPTRRPKPWHLHH